VAGARGRNRGCPNGLVYEEEDEEEEANRELEDEARKRSLALVEKGG
jgi:hypothetical protein